MNFLSKSSSVEALILNLVENENNVAATYRADTLLSNEFIKYSLCFVGEFFSYFFIFLFLLRSSITSVSSQVKKLSTRFLRESDIFCSNWNKLLCSSQLFLLGEQ